MNIDFEIEELKKEYKKALKELHELLVLFNPHCSEDATFESAMERLIGNQLTEDEETLLFDIFKANKSIKDLDIRIKKLEVKKDYDDQVRACYLAYITQQEKRRMMDDDDEYFKCFERYIPDEVETGYFATEEDRIIAEQTHACYEEFTTQQDEDEVRNIINKNVEKYATYIPEEVETGYNPIEEKPRGIKKVQLETMPVVEDINLEEGEYVSNSELARFVNKVNNKIDQNISRRRTNKSDAFRRRYDK